MEYTAEVCRLSQAFYKAYPVKKYPELLTKSTRSYTCLLIDTHKDYRVCIPFRSSIHHNVAFLFTETERSRRTRSGLDYTKCVLVRDPAFIDRENTAMIDDDEYIIVMHNLDTIVRDIEEYIAAYARHADGSAPLDEREYERKYKYSTLPYFHDILKIQPPADPA